MYLFSSHKLLGVLCSERNDNNRFMLTIMERLCRRFALELRMGYESLAYRFNFLKDLVFILF